MSIQNFLSTGFSLHQQGRIEDALFQYSQALLLTPEDFDALHLSGMAYLQLGKFDLAIDSLNKAVLLNESHLLARLHLGSALAQAGNLDDAKVQFEYAIELDPKNHNAHYSLGTLLANQKSFESAKQHFVIAISIKPDYYEAKLNLGNTLCELGSYEKAIFVLEDLAKTHPNHPQILLSLASAQTKNGSHLNALTTIDKLIEINDSIHQAHENRGLILFEMGNPVEALKSLQISVSKNTQSSTAHRHLGLIYFSLKNNPAAKKHVETAISLSPADASSWVLLGNINAEIGQNQAALINFEKAILLSPWLSDAHASKAAFHLNLGEYYQAIEHYKKLVEIDQKYDKGLSHLIHCLMKTCEWQGLQEKIESALLEARIGIRSLSPLTSLCIVDDPYTLLKIAKIASSKSKKVDVKKFAIESQSKKQRIRIGYFSPDFNNHPVSYLMAGIFESHNRTEYEIYGYGMNNSGSTGSNWGDRVKSSFDRFFDISELSDTEVIQLARSHNIDIAVDLAGHTQGARIQIFTHRIAPLQINYLGFPGTSGALNVDYIIGDHIVIPVDSADSFSEKIIYLPTCFQANDDKKPINTAELPCTYGLPTGKFIFACFAQVTKITPQIFELWMRILKSAKNSCLWLILDNPQQVNNLYIAAEKNGVDRNRLLFAQKTDYASHLGRYKHVDLVLDTFPFSGGTTTSDALWAETPVLTRAGNTFASRMSTSLLSCLGAEDLIVKNWNEYHDTAVSLALDPLKHSEIKAKIKNGKIFSNLFKTHHFTKNLEIAYHKILDRHLAGLEPENIEID